MSSKFVEELKEMIEEVFTEPETMSYSEFELLQDCKDCTITGLFCMMELIRRNKPVSKAIKGNIQNIMQLMDELADNAVEFVENLESEEF